jgi:hypothetical protein
MIDSDAVEVQKRRHGSAYSAGPVAGRVSITRVAVGVIFLGAFCNPAIAQRQDRPSLEQIIEGIQNTEALLFGGQSLLLRYERTKSENVTEDVNRPGHLLLTEWTFAFKGDKWFSQHRFTQPRKNADGTVVPKEPFFTVLKGDLQLVWNKSGASAGIMQFDLGGNLYWNEYTRNLSINLPRLIAHSRGIEGRMEEVRK